MTDNDDVSLQERLGIGCGDSACIFGRPAGMATNGGCRCFRNVPPLQRVEIHAGIRRLREIASMESTGGKVLAALRCVLDRAQCYQEVCR